MRITGTLLLEALEYSNNLLKIKEDEDVLIGYAKNIINVSGNYDGQMVEVLTDDFDMIKNKKLYNEVINYIKNKQKDLENYKDEFETYLWLNK
ncbi:hypothetical protein ACWOAQ_02515 [Helcococcus kunzii]|uniref:hypothetical protein n=1 Tax=Helcococcus kunzii TaxID=40091 RepID=UPI001BAF8ECA|nr:hypothetical protein [Helcococcus kunzii]MCT1796202.1 hypothetical protein [Helcococcus kunzii]MCT1988943.1 hypothetical protein [Helcococcus kunzii]QUY64308.1 hypothetical protein GUI37_01765 [Helcococcus kunzii]